MNLTPQTAELVRVGGGHVPQLLARVEQRLRACATSHGELLAQHAGATIAAGGKRLRPLLVVLAAGEVQGDAAQAVVSAATAVELVHSATLVHDDVLDGADLRRGQATVVAAAGRAMATATGDLLFSRAFAELAQTADARAVASLSAACSALARGELLQRADAWDGAITVERYLKRCELKTASLFQASCSLGLLAAGREVAELGDFGARIGLAFQMLDDVLDISGPPDRTGKHRGTDLLDGTVTLPFIKARDRDRSLAQLDPRSILTPERAQEVCDRIAATGALDEVRAVALEYVSAAKAGLSPGLDPGRRAALELVANSVVARYS